MHIKVLIGFNWLRLEKGGCVSDSGSSTLCKGWDGRLSAADERYNLSHFTETFHFVPEYSVK